MNQNEDAEQEAAPGGVQEQSHRIHQSSHQEFVEKQQANLLTQHNLQQQMMNQEGWAGGDGAQLNFDHRFPLSAQGAHPGAVLSHQINLQANPQFFQQPVNDRYQAHHGLPNLAQPGAMQNQPLGSVPQPQLGNLPNQMQIHLRDPHTLPHAQQFMEPQQARYQQMEIVPPTMNFQQPTMQFQPNPAEPTVQPPQRQQPVQGRAIEWEELSNVAVLKHGSGTTVFSAELDGQIVAVKAPKHGLNRGSHEEVTMELRHEAKVLSNINHPHVIRFYGAGTVIVGDGHRVFFIVVEILAGSLADRLKLKDKDKDAISYAQAMELLLALSQAINHLHNECDPAAITIHRDLKPDNIGFTHDGILKLFDFGLAAVIPRAIPVDEIRQNGGRRLPRFRLTGQTGSVRYMAPEVALNQPYNERVDTYSFAMVAYEVLGKRKPFHGMTVETHREVVCRGGQRPQLDRSRPQELNLLFEACWAQDIDTRPDFSAVVQRVDLLLADSKLAEESLGGKKHGVVGASMIPRAFRSFGMGMGPKTTGDSEVTKEKSRLWF